MCFFSNWGSVFCFRFLGKIRKIQTLTNSYRAFSLRVNTTQRRKPTAWTFSLLFLVLFSEVRRCFSHKFLTCSSAASHSNAQSSRGCQSERSWERKQMQIFSVLHWWRCLDEEEEEDLGCFWEVLVVASRSRQFWSLFACHRGQRVKKEGRFLSPLPSSELFSISSLHPTTTLSLSRQIPLQPWVIISPDGNYKASTQITWVVIRYIMQLLWSFLSGPPPPSFSSHLQK